jgi:hypothetical protein
MNSYDGFEIRSNLGTGWTRLQQWTIFRGKEVGQEVIENDENKEPRTDGSVLTN